MITSVSSTLLGYVTIKRQFRWGWFAHNIKHIYYFKTNWWFHRSVGLKPHRHHFHSPHGSLCQHSCLDSYWTSTSWMLYNWRLYRPLLTPSDPSLEATQTFIHRHIGQGPVHRHIPFSEKIKFVLFSLNASFDHHKLKHCNSFSKEPGEQQLGTVRNHHNYCLSLCSMASTEESIMQLITVSQALHHFVA